ncbi:hypothetical protein [Corynebacterium epidermidicanis]|nr:hypothetical protein [Corynebacterium epidermidicanis]
MGQRVPNIVAGLLMLFAWCYVVIVRPQVDWLSYPMQRPQILLLATS